MGWRLLGALFAAIVSGMAQAQPAYPARAVRIIVPFAPGGGTDIVARILAARLSDKLGQGFFIDNRPAGSGIVGADAVAKATPDGYTILFAFSSLSSSAKLMSKLPYDPVADFAPVTVATVSPLVLFIHPSLPARTVQEFIAYAKANPGKLNYGSSGLGSSPHLGTELFMSMTGISMTHIPYKGIAPAITAQLANEVQLTMTPIAVGMPHVRAGRLVAMAAAGLKRSGAIPGVLVGAQLAKAAPERALKVGLAVLLVGLGFHIAISGGTKKPSSEPAVVAAGGRG